MVRRFGRAAENASRPHALLLTGQPGIGKTTVVRRVAAALSGRKLRVKGFVTEEIRVGRERVGFRLEDFEGHAGVFAHVEFRSSDRVGKYGVDVAALDDLVEASLASEKDRPADLYLIDEIGKMESLSRKFVTAIERLLDSRSLLVATIGARGGGLIERVKKRPDVELLTVTRRNRDSVPSEVLTWLESRLQSRR